LHREAGGTYPLESDVQRLYERARGTLVAATRADAANFDAWLRLAWTAQILGERDAAREAYERALVLDPKSPLPLRGLIVLYTGDEKGYRNELGRLAREEPKARKVLVLQALDLLEGGKADDAIVVLESYLAEREGDADALHLLARAWRKKGEATQADLLEWKALAANPDLFAAAEALDVQLRTGGIARAKASLEAARKILAAYRKLLAASPRNPYVRNNLGYLMREAWNAHREDEAWLEILSVSAEAYAEATRIIGPFTPKKARTLSWETRWAYAQMVNDTAVIFHLYEPVRDLQRAEDDYRLALEYTAYGYPDAWTYLRRIYTEQKRWKDLRDLALRCAQGLCNAKGEPLSTAREGARK
ncbi:MAG: tetratricopeptide repeat protein, partial [Planctomycetota bacterium]